MPAPPELGLALDAAIRAGDDRAQCDAYAATACYWARAGDTDAACFFWTQALVYALSSGDEIAETTLRERLSAHGRL